MGPVLHSALTAARACPVQIVDIDPAAFVAAGPAAAHGFDVWVPDSSQWAGAAAAAGIVTAVAVPSVASSPVVYAVAGSAATAQPQPTTADLLPGNGSEAARDRIAVPDPSRSARSVAGLLTLQEGISAAAAATALTYAVRISPPDLPTADSALLPYAATHPGVAVPVTEQDIAAFQKLRPTTPVARIATPGNRYRLDYPLLSLAGSTAPPPAVRAFVTALSTPPARAALAATGFDGSPGSGPVPTRADLSALVAEVELIEKPATTLALIDISGSMAQQVPGGSGSTRLDYARAAAVRGLQEFPLNSRIGLWVFSRNLLPGQDYRQLVPIRSIGDPAGQQQLAARLAGIRVNPDGGTGLYDTVLAAVRQVRDGWDPGRFNSVLVLSDGQNDDRGSIGLTELTRTLTAEQGGRPVPVIGIAFGPDSDVQALQRISAATGGETYVARNPMDISQIFLEAVGHRIVSVHR